MGADGVEVSQRDTLQSLVCRNRVAKDILAHLLGVAVGRGRRLAGRLLRDGQVVSLAVNRRRRREDDVLTAVLTHQIHDVHERSEVVAVILHGVGHRLANGLEGGEVYHRIELVLLEYAAEGLLVAAVDIDEGHIHARDLAYALDAAHVGIRQVVGNDNIIAGIYQLHGGMRTDIARAARNQNHLFHHSCVFYILLLQR